MSTRTPRTVLILLAILPVPTSARAQAGSPTTIELSFSNPGARSLGFGGAFVALADDATAAFANPAGLMQLSTPEVSVEGRLWSYSTPFTEGGRVSGQPTGNLLDNTPGLRSRVSSESLLALSFMSFVYPREDWSLAFYRHQSANFEVATETQGLFFDSFELDGSDLLVASTEEARTFRFADLRTFTDFEMVTYGVAGAYRLTETFSLGAALAYFDAIFTTKADVFAPVEETLPDGAFGENAYLPAARFLSSEVTTTDGGDWGVTGGFLWQVAQQWSVGGFYRQGPSLKVLQQDVSGPVLEPIVPDGTLLSSAPSPLGLPDVYGLGTAFKSQSGAVTVSFEWDRVQYSTITRSLDEALSGGELELDDGHEIHLGFEYVFIGSSTPIIALRSGVWRDPDHRIRFVGDDEFIRALLPSGDDEVHFALGFGVAFQKFQLDFGVDLSDLVDSVSFSAIYSF